MIANHQQNETESNAFSSRSVKVHHFLRLVLQTSLGQIEFMNEALEAMLVQSSTSCSEDPCNAVPDSQRGEIPAAFVVR